MSDLMLDVDQAGELKAAFRRGDWSKAEIKKLCEGDVLARMRNVVRGFAKIVIVIDCDADPFVPRDWKVKEHKKGGQWEWDLTRVKLHLSPNQRDGKIIEGNKLRTELASEPVLNVNVLDYLLAHPELIPEEWRGKLIFFWGTIYGISDRDICVRYLDGCGSQWNWGYRCLNGIWHGSNPIVVRK